MRHLSQEEDNDFMLPRIKNEKVLAVSFFTSNDSYEGLSGMFHIWPDGYVYVVDTQTMNSHQRTVSYLSAARYADLYQRLMRITQLLTIG